MTDSADIVRQGLPRCLSAVRGSDRQRDQVLLPDLDPR